jgi:hypothetical protein
MRAVVRPVRRGMSPSVILPLPQFAGILTLGVWLTIILEREGATN